MKSTPHYFRIGIGSDGKTEFNFESFLDTVRKDRVLVIGVSGKSHFGDGKGSFVDHYIQKDAFGPWNEMDESGEDFVEGVHDPSSNLIFLHLKNFHDGSNLLHGIQKMKDMGVQAYLAQGRETTVLMNLFLFHVCHIVIIHFPSPHFDTSYVQLFKTVETLRWEFMSQISKIMNCCDFPQEKVTNGRFFNPKTLILLPYSSSSFKSSLYLRRRSFEINDDYDSPFVPYYEDIALDESRKNRNFSRFLNNHISWMWSRAKGNSNGNWEKHVRLFLLSFNNEELRRSNKMESYVNVIKHVSKSICSMALPRALDKYEDGLPSHYLEEYHNIKLLQAMSVLSIHARGPCAVEYAKTLQEECTYYWASSRQQCEAVSLSGKHCIKRIHGDEEIHSSNYVFNSACNCGKTQISRSDPFNIKEANFDFYFRLEDGCCQDMEHWELPFKNPSDNLHLSRISIVEDLMHLSDTLDQLSIEDSNQKSQTEFEGIGYNVLTEEEFTKDLSPELPYWSLIHMGPSSKYSHSSGLNQPGFLGNYKHLLSWDIPITKTDLTILKEKWSNLVDTAVKKMTFNPRGDGVEMGILAKVFFGCEYECSRGHRFIANSPDFKASSSKSSSRGISTRGFGAQVAESYMPLYITCCCSSRRSIAVGQLMRIHVVTPKAPINVNLLPKVMPTEGGPVFVTGCMEPIKLPPNTYWIIRLPFLYSSKDGGIHLPPIKVNETNSGKLLQGFINVTEEFEDD
ncbi:nonsense-mediated mRNA decay factor SMG8 [Lepeophtheirus salmonis]|uniref:nonsense-mediated mRNA decay factor SMG8 n=1 Tax=Lepeophtheirus salmonis TaxID=72036 RepID=UPI001AE9E028|nr:protein SMG8-like [Lepeophtheirus salmonis]